MRTLSPGTSSIRLTAEPTRFKGWLLLRAEPKWEIANGFWRQWAGLSAIWRPTIRPDWHCHRKWNSIATPFGCCLGFGKSKAGTPFPLLLRKIADFWLSADQILDTKSLPTRERVLRGMGVVIYLLILSLAVRGLYRMSQTRPEIASIFLVYVVGYTLLHLPLVMNTRLRIPLAEPLIIVLAGAGWTSLPYVAGLLREASEALSSADFPDSVSER